MTVDLRAYCRAGLACIGMLPHCKRGIFMTHEKILNTACLKEKYDAGFGEEEFILK